MTELKNIAVLETLERLGAQGKALADDIRAVRDEEQFLGSFYPNAESATARNLLATGQGADLYSRPGASSMPVNALADAALMGSGLAAAPIMTAMRQGPKLYRGIMQPRTATREDMTRVLMSRPKPGERVLARQADNAAPVNPLNVTPPPAPSGPPMNALAPAARIEPPPLVMPEAQQIGRWEGPAPQKPQSLLAWVRGQGGIKDRNYMSGDLKAVMGKANAMPGLLNNQSGKGLDDIVAAAYEQGFDVDPNDANSLMRLIEEEMAGNPSYRIGAREEWDIYQEYLAARRGDLSETPDSFGARGNPEALGAAGGTAIGMATAPDQNGDGVVDAQERMLGGAGGALTGGIAGRGVRGGMNALAQKPRSVAPSGNARMGFGGNPPGGSKTPPSNVTPIGNAPRKPPEPSKPLYSPLERGEWVEEDPFVTLTRQIEESGLSVRSDPNEYYRPFSMDNTNGYSQSDLDLLNKATETLSRHDGISKSEAAELVERNWQSQGNTVETLSGIKTVLPFATRARSAKPDVAALKQQGFNTDKVYYHGGDKEFDVFDMTKAGRREVPWYGRGAYLTPDSRMAKNYAGPGGKVMPFYVRGKMLEIRKPEDWPSWLNKEADIPQQLKDRGYVGLDIDIKTQGPQYDKNFRPIVDAQGKLVTKEESMPEVVVFDPANIVRAPR